MFYPIKLYYIYGRIVYIPLAYSWENASYGINVINKVKKNRNKALIFYATVQYTNINVINIRHQKVMLVVFFAILCLAKEQSA